MRGSLKIWCIKISFKGSQWSFQQLDQPKHSRLRQETVLHTTSHITDRALSLGQSCSADRTSSRCIGLTKFCNLRALSKECLSQHFIRRKAWTSFLTILKPNVQLNLHVSPYQRSASSMTTQAVWQSFNSPVRDALLTSSSKVPFSRIAHSGFFFRAKKEGGEKGGDSVAK